MIPSYRHELFGRKPRVDAVPVYYADFRTGAGTAMIERRSWMAPAPASKRLLRASSCAAHSRMLVKVAIAAACALATACDGGHDDPNARSSAADAIPMLPGTRNVASAPLGSGAQRFDAADGAQQHPASDALLPPVMHTAD